MSGDRSIQTIAVAGGGIVGLSAAIAFARALPRALVTVLELPADPAALADRLPTAWPSVARFHAAIGLDEHDLVRCGIAIHHVGTIFEGWPAGQWVHAFGPYGKPVGAIPFDQIWVRANMAGQALPYDRYSLGAALARSGKFVHPSQDPDQLGSRFAYGLRFDPEPYRERLRDLALTAGVTFCAGDIREIEPGEAGISALRLTDGSRIEADLFIDCTGPQARLLRTIDDSVEDWSRWMPFGRIALGFSDDVDDAATADRMRGSDAGWTIEWPLRGRTMTACLTIEGEGVAIARHRRLRPWVGNVLALGEAATALDPLHGMNLNVAQQAILLALELLPGRDFHPLETAEYNRRAEQLTRRVRDFAALHYPSSLKAEDAPESLARTLGQYRHRGRLPFHEDESVTRDSWTAALIGMGFVPEHADAQALVVPLDQAVAAMAELADAIDKTVAGLPTYHDYLARIGR